MSGEKCMDMKASTLAISAVILLALAGISHGSHEYPRVGNYFTSSARVEYCEVLSKWDVVILNRKVRYNKPEVLTTLRNMNPDIEILPYFPCASVWAGYDTLDAAALGFGEKVAACDWWLYDDKGNRMGDPSDSWLINFSSKCPIDEDGKTAGEWLGKYIADTILLGGPWDGVFLDRLFDDPWWLNSSDWFQDPPAMLDIDRDGVADDPDSARTWWRAGVLSFLEILRQEAGQSYILVGNGKHCLSDYLNGGVREDFPHMHGGWEENMLSYYGYFALCRELLDYPMQCTLMLCFWRDDENTMFEPKRSTTYERFLRYTLCSALLDDGYYFMYGGTNTLWWEDYYDLDLGAPMAAACRDSVWNQMYSRFSPVWRRDFENATVYCNPYQEYICFDGGWLGPEDGLIKMHVVPSSVGISILSVSVPARRFDQGDPYVTYEMSITNLSDNAVFANVWAKLTREGTTLVSGSQLEYLVGAQDTTVKERVLRLPPTLGPGTYCLEVMVGGPDFAEVARDTMMLTKIISLEKQQFKHDSGVVGGSVTVYPQPAVASGGNISVEINPGSSSGHFCSVRLYDVNGRLVNRAFGQKLASVLSLDINLTGNGGAPLAPGVYFLSVDLEDQALTKKLVVLRR